MLSTPLIPCSIGAATVCAITSAEAPAKVARTTTVGGAISGYSVIGSARYAMAPTSVRRIEMTAAKIGRSIKKWEKRMVAVPVSRRPKRAVRRPLLRGGFDLAVLGLDLLARAGALQAFDHDAVGGGEPRANEAQTVHDRAELHP